MGKCVNGGGEREDRRQRTEDGEQDIRKSGEQDSRRIGKLELRMDSVSKPALSPFGCAQGKLRRMGAA